MFFFYLFVSLILTVLLLPLKKTAPATSDQGETNLHEVWEFIKKYGGNHTSHLHLLDDKQFFWAHNKQVLISYQRVGKTFVILGDPIGDDELITSSIDEFEQYSHSNGKKTVFYQVSPHFINEFQKRGYRAIKLGEEAKLDLLNFTLDGKKGAKLRTRKNKFERNGYKFDVLFPSYSKQLLEEINEISNSWLGTRKEKGFSVGSFCKNYINRFPLAILYNPDGKAIAFATLACNYRVTNRTITIDLMRYHLDSPHGTMDMLFLSIFNWCKEQGYEWCSMGMSPLANLKEGPTKNKFEPIGQFIFHKGNQFYNFKGLYEYKNKFQPSWESRYLVYRRNFLPKLIIQLIWLINRKPIPIIKMNQINIIQKIINKAG